MALETHIQTLEKRHQELEDKLASLAASPSSADSELNELKRQKLQLKDEIHRLKQEAA